MPRFAGAGHSPLRSAIALAIPVGRQLHTVGYAERVYQGTAAWGSGVEATRLAHVFGGAGGLLQEALGVDLRVGADRGVCVQ